MVVQVKCAFCDQPFEFDRTQESLLADCPHCKKQNTIFISTGPSKEMRIQRDAPNLSGSKVCPSCKSTIGRDAVLCIRCGHDFKTGKKIAKPSWTSQHKKAVVATAAGLVLLVATLAFVLWPKSLPPPIAPITPPLAVQPTTTTPPPPPAAPAAPPAAVAKPVAPTPPPAPPAPSPAQLAAKQAETDRAAFEAKKRQAELKLRQKLDAGKPMYKVDGAVELRRRNGVIDKGMLRGFSGEGTQRAALIEKPTGKASVPLVSLDPDSRIRLDPEYREAFIRHLLSLPQPAEKPKS